MSEVGPGGSSRSTPGVGSGIEQIEAPRRDRKGGGQWGVSSAGSGRQGWNRVRQHVAGTIRGRRWGGGALHPGQGGGGEVGCPGSASGPPAGSGVGRGDREGSPGGTIERRRELGGQRGGRDVAEAACARGGVTGAREVRHDGLRRGRGDRRIVDRGGGARHEDSGAPTGKGSEWGGRWGTGTDEGPLWTFARTGSFGSSRGDAQGQHGEPGSDELKGTGGGMGEEGEGGEERGGGRGRGKGGERGGGGM